MYQPLSPGKIRQIFKIWQAQNPHPTTELDYQNAYQLLVAVVLSAQTTDKAVNRATANFFPHITTPEAMLAWSEAALTEAIRTIGLFRSKAKNVIALSAQLISQHQSQVPEDLTALMALPGVGLKTASVIMNTLYGAPMVAVDTHVFRLAHRLGLAQGKTPEHVAMQLPKVIPKAYLRHAHHWLILHGRYVCVARAPKCATCTISAHCPKNTL